MAIEDINVSMIRSTLENLPQFELPAPFTMRGYQPGDEVHWVDIHNAADPAHTYSLEKFAHEFEAERALLPTQQTYLCDGDGLPVGTATAWTYQVNDQPIGLVHWVAIHPDSQGKGLAKPLLARICHKLHEMGFAQGFLNTSTSRIPAIGLYLRLGFVPYPRGDEATARHAWQVVREHLAHPAIDAFLADMD